MYVLSPATLHLNSWDCSGLKRHDGEHDAGPRVRYPGCGRSHEFRGDHEVRLNVSSMLCSVHRCPFRHVKSMEYSVIVFDTAPTGHTLRFLSFPTVLEKALGKLSTLSGRLGPMISQMTSLMGGQADAPEDMFAKLESMRAVITEVNTQFKDPVSVTCAWTCAFIAEMHIGIFRKRRHSFACASPSFCRYMRQNGWCRSLPRTRLTRITLWSTSFFSPRRVCISCNVIPETVLVTPS